MPTRFRAGGGAFTLIELLVVVAIISILASIAVPNFLEAQTRSKVSRVQADMRSIAVALESYAVDNNKYPPRKRRPVASPLTMFSAGDADTIVQDLGRVTTPIAYISSIPLDVFKADLIENQRYLDYWDPEITSLVRRQFTEPSNPLPNPVQFPKESWALFSFGPDRAFGSTASLTITGYPRSSSLSYPNDYDPTNGTVSLGNVFRFQRQESAILVLRTR